MAARRGVLEPRGLYDRMILGGGDRIILSAAMGIDPAESPYISDHPESLVADARQWCHRISAETKGSLSYTKGSLLHLWHGTFANRRYSKRARLLDGFDVHKDIRVDGQGAWSWSSDKPTLHEAIRRYFLLRREDGEPRSAWRNGWGLLLGKVLNGLIPARRAGYCCRSSDRIPVATEKGRPEQGHAGTS